MSFEDTCKQILRRYMLIHLLLYINLMIDRCLGFNTRECGEAAELLASFVFCYGFTLFDWTALHFYHPPNPSSTSKTSTTIHPYYALQDLSRIGPIHRSLNMPPPLAIHRRLHAFIAAVKQSVIMDPTPDRRAYILYTDPFKSSSHFKFFPFQHRLEGKGLSMVHFHNISDTFNATGGGIQLTELALESCTIPGSLFYWLVNEKTHSLSLKDVHVFENSASTTSGERPALRVPAWWEDVLPIFAHHANLDYCYLEGLHDHSTRQSADRSAVPLFRAEGRQSVKKGLKELYWELCWRTWCTDPVEQSLSEIHYELRSFVDPGCASKGPVKKQSAASIPPKQSAHPNSLLSDRSDRNTHHMTPQRQ